MCKREICYARTHTHAHTHPHAHTHTHTCTTHTPMHKHTQTFIYAYLFHSLCCCLLPYLSEYVFKLEHILMLFSTDTSHWAIRRRSDWSTMKIVCLESCS